MSFFRRKSKQPQQTPQPERPAATWDGDQGIRLRRYESYEEYTEHQASKLAKLDLTNYSKRFREALTERLKLLPNQPRGSTVLCLGARNGAECEAFIEKGFFAVGVDLNPGTSNKTVLHGDFHNLQFASESVDIVFTNTLDHAFNLDKVIGEVSRVLKPKGLLITEIVRGSTDEAGREPGDFESAWWDSLEAVIDHIQRLGFTLWERQRFEYPWNGDQCIFLKN